MKNITYKDKINNAFNFTYAGVVNIFITFTRKKYIVVSRGFELENQNIVLFNKSKTFRNSYDSLYEAISRFNILCNIVTDSMDWFTPHYFEDSDFFNKVYSNYVY